MLPFQISTPPAIQAPAPAPAKPDLPPGFKPTFHFVVRPWGLEHLGSIGPKETKEISWTLENLSDKPMTFLVSDLSPGVTVADDPFKEPVAPHAKRVFTLRVDATGWLAYQKRGVQLVVPHDSTQPKYRVLFDMDVRPDLTVDATRKSLGDVAPYESPQTSFTFTRETGEPLELKLDSKLPPYLEPEIVSKGPRAEVRFTLRAAKVPLGQLEGLEILKVTTNAPNQPTFDLYVDWRIKLAVRPQPSRVVFNDPQVKALTLTLTADKPFHIQSADLAADGFALDAVPSTESKTQKLTLRRLRDDAKAGLLTLTFSGVQDPLKIPVSWLDPSAR